MIESAARLDGKPIVNVPPNALLLTVRENGAECFLQQRQPEKYEYGGRTLFGCTAELSNRVDWSFSVAQDACNSGFYAVPIETKQGSGFLHYSFGMQLLRSVRDATGGWETSIRGRWGDGFSLQTAARKGCCSWIVFRSIRYEGLGATSYIAKADNPDVAFPVDESLRYADGFVLNGDGAPCLLTQDRVDRSFWIAKWNQRTQQVDRLIVLPQKLNGLPRSLAVSPDGTIHVAAWDSASQSVQFGTVKDGRFELTSVPHANYRSGPTHLKLMFDGQASPVLVVGRLQREGSWLYRATKNSD